MHQNNDKSDDESINFSMHPIFKCEKQKHDNEWNERTEDGGNYTYFDKSSVTSITNDYSFLHQIDIKQGTRFFQDFLMCFVHLDNMTDHDFSFCCLSAVTKHV